TDSKAIFKQYHFVTGKGTAVGCASTAVGCASTAVGCASTLTYSNNGDSLNADHLRQFLEQHFVINPNFHYQVLLFTVNDDSEIKHLAFFSCYSKIRFVFITEQIYLNSLDFNQNFALTESFLEKIPSYS